MLIEPKPHDPRHRYVLTMRGCGHGVLFRDHCRDCEIVQLTEQYRNAVRTVQRVRDRMRVLGSPMHGSVAP